MSNINLPLLPKTLYKGHKRNRSYLSVNTSQTPHKRHKLPDGNPENSSNVASPFSLSDYQASLAPSPEPQTVFSSLPQPILVPQPIRPATMPNFMSGTERPSSYASRMSREEQMTAYTEQLDHMSQQFGQADRLGTPEHAYIQNQRTHLRNAISELKIAPKNADWKETALLLAQSGFHRLADALIVLNIADPRDVKEGGFRTPSPSQSLPTLSEKLVLPDAKPFVDSKTFGLEPGDSLLTNAPDDDAYLPSRYDNIAIGWRTYEDALKTKTSRPKVDHAREGFNIGYLEDEFSWKPLGSGQGSVNNVQVLSHDIEGTYYLKDFKEQPAQYACALLNEDLLREILGNNNTSKVSVPEQALVYSGVDDSVHALVLAPKMLSRSYQEGLMENHSKTTLADIHTLMDDPDPAVREEAKDIYRQVEMAAQIMGDTDTKYAPIDLMRNGKYLHKTADGTITAFSYASTSANYPIAKDSQDKNSAVRVDLDYGLLSFECVDKKAHSVEPRFSESRLFKTPENKNFTNTPPITYDSLEKKPSNFYSDFLQMTTSKSDGQGAIHPIIKEIFNNFRPTLENFEDKEDEEFLDLAQQTFQGRLNNEVYKRAAGMHPNDRTYLNTEQIQNYVTKVEEEKNRLCSMTLDPQNQTS